MSEYFFLQKHYVSLVEKGIAEAIGLFKIVDSDPIPVIMSLLVKLDEIKELSLMLPEEHNELRLSALNFLQQSYEQLQSSYC